MSDNELNTQVSEIARRIHELRDLSDLSLAEMAATCSVTEDEMKSYEGGEVDIPISFLIKLSEKFHMDMTEMITGEAPKLTTYALTRKGKGVKVLRRKHYEYRNLAYNFIGRKVEPLDVLVPVGINPEFVPSSHDGHEFDYVLEGKLRLHIDGKEVLLTSGDSIYYDSRHPHALEAVDADVHMLAIVIP